MSIGDIKMKKSFVFVALACTLLAFNNGCSKKKTEGVKQIRIGVIQLLEHAALDSAYKGFVDGLAAAGYVDGQNIKIDYQNAQNEQANCVAIAQKFVNDRVDLIFAIATPAAQAVANLTKDIPILVSAVTDPESTKLVQSNALPGTNVSGTSDLTPCAAQIQLLVKLFPEAKTVGMLYCSSEQNSILQVGLAKAECERLGLKTMDFTVSNSNEIQQVVQSAVGKVDALYAPTDNMIAAGMVNVSQVAIPAKLPVICGEEGMVEQGGLATYGINYYKLGLQTAKMAVEILKDGKNPKDMPIEYLEDCEFRANEKTFEALGLSMPEEFLN